MKKAALIAVPLLGLATAAGAAEPRYDHTLEQAAAGIVASRIGDIRGGFSFRDKPQFVVVQSPPRSGGRAGLDLARPDAAGDDGLVPAVEQPAHLVN